MAAILKYLKYYIPGITSILFIVILLMGENYPTYFLIGFSILPFAQTMVSESRNIKI